MDTRYTDVQLVPCLRAVKQTAREIGVAEVQSSRVAES